MQIETELPALLESKGLVEMIEEDLKYHELECLHYEDLYYQELDPVLECLHYEEIVTNLYDEFDPELSLIYIKNDITNLFNSLKDSSKAGNINPNIKIKYLKELKEILNNI